VNITKNVFTKDFDDSFASKCVLKMLPLEKKVIEKAGGLEKVATSIRHPDQIGIQYQHRRSKACVYHIDASSFEGLCAAGHLPIDSEDL
jgi:hypothetical protein